RAWTADPPRWQPDWPPGEDHQKRRQRQFHCHSTPASDTKPDESVLPQRQLDPQINVTDVHRRRSALHKRYARCGGYRIPAFAWKLLGPVISRGRPFGDYK